MDRKGLGLASDKNQNLNRRYFSEYLHKYHTDPDNIHELVFSTEFTKEERATLHTYVFRNLIEIISFTNIFVENRIAAKQGLKSTSKNTADGERYLIISKKIPLNILATNVLNGGIYSEMYELKHPSENN